MTKQEEIIEGLKFTVAMCEYDPSTGETIQRCFMNDMTGITYDACKAAIEALKSQPFINKPCISEGVCHEDKIQVLDKIRAEIKGKIEQDEFARSVFRYEEKDTVKAEQCTGSIMAYNNMIKIIDKYKAESEVRNDE